MDDGARVSRTYPVLALATSPALGHPLTRRVAQRMALRVEALLAFERGSGQAIFQFRSHDRSLMPRRASSRVRTIPRRRVTRPSPSPSFPASEGQNTLKV